jgi:hypothetical protein
VIEEPAHAAAATMMALVAMEAERMAAEKRAMMAAVTALVVGVTSKHVVLDPVSLYRNYRYIGLVERQERFPIYLKPI